MKKIIFAIPLLALMMASCDPKEVDLGSPDGSISQEQLANGFSFTQWGDEAHTQSQDNGNYFTFTTSPAQPVIVYQLVDGVKNVIGSGSSGQFKIVPKRGQSESQTFYVMAGNTTDLTVVEKTATVYVPSELTPEMKLLVSDDGEKIWKWDTEFRADGGAWGNMGYAPGDGASFAEQGNGIWWGGNPNILNTPDQLKNAPNGQPQGDASTKAYMKFKEDGSVEVYDSLGNVLRQGKFEMKDYDGTRHVATIDGSQSSWSYGTLSTTGDNGAVMWPFKINGKGTIVKDFEVLQLDVNHLKLVYAAPGTGSWSEATWWAFKSESDGIGALTDYGSKSWTWDTEFRADGGAWGNMGYAPGDGDSFANSGNGIWWGCQPEYLENPNEKGETQLQHSTSTTPLGYGAGAYMTFDWKGGTVTSYDASGKQIASGKYEIQNWGNGNRTISSIDGSQAQWALGKLHTEAGSILWPFRINNKGTDPTPTDFEIMQLNSNHLKLIYAAPGTGSWSEATWWAFKAKK